MSNINKYKTLSTLTTTKELLKSSSSLCCSAVAGVDTTIKNKTILQNETGAETAPFCSQYRYRYLNNYVLDLFLKSDYRIQLNAKMIYRKSATFF